PSLENQLAFLRCKGSQQRTGYTKGWENYDIEYIPIPSGYAEWGTIILAKHSFNLRGDGEDSNTFLFHDGERTVILLYLHYIMGLPMDGEFYEEYVPSHHEREPSMLLYPKCLSQLLEVWDELQVGGEVSLQEWLDQIVPYLVLKSVYTEDDFGVAYSYWAHLLRPINQDFSCLPNETRIGSCTIYWINWYRKFSEPFISVLTNLRCGCARGRVHYNDRKRLAAGKIIPRHLSPSDFVVIREHSEINLMEGSSLQHVSTDNTSQKDSMDDQVYMQPEDNRMRRLSEDTLLCDSEESLTKRKLDFSQPIGGDNSTATLIPYPTITGNEDFVPSSSDVAQVGDGDDDVTNFCLTRREPPTCDVAQVGDGDDDVTNFCLIRREPPTSPFIDSCVDTTELAEDYSSFPCALPSVVNFSDIDSFLD
ncbi:hypothetical protein ACJX0J_024581, partial [Zea mays]